MAERSNSKIKNGKKKILVIDDHPIVRQGLARLISQEEDMLFAGEAGDASEGLDQVNALKPDAVVVDISLKGTSGIELIKTILNYHPHIPILVVSMHEEMLYVERALRAGAKGYLMKQEATDHVIAALRKILGGEVYVSDKIKDSLMHKFLFKSNSQTGNHSPEGLSDRELEVLQLIGQGYATRQIAEELHVSMKTIESHYANIKMKLDLKNSHELIQYAVKWSLSK
ncbi:MAG: response regulator transcription factor [Deltaproteobacteria bacterium]|nr:response regulator transcription factor [Deltaproteobacteria bacterium]